MKAVFRVELSFAGCLDCTGRRQRLIGNTAIIVDIRYIVRRQSPNDMSGFNSAIGRNQ